MQPRMIQPLEVLVVQMTGICDFVYDAFSLEIQRIKKEQGDSTSSA